MWRSIQIVVIGAIRQNGRYLLTKRYNPRRKLTHDRWQMPGGGLEFNETIIRCLRREVKEETGIEVKIVRLVPYIYEKIIQKEGWHAVAICFLYVPKEKKPRVKINREASEYRWFTYKELKKLKLHFGTATVIDEAEKIGVGERTCPTTSVSDSD